MIPIRSFAVVVSLLTLPTATGSSIVSCLGAAKPSSRWELPALFREISGMALTADGRLFVHNDEVAVIGAFDPNTGAVLGSYRLGGNPPLGDFEGIAVGAGRLWLTTSDGDLYQSPLPPPNASSTAPLPFTVIKTGIGALCEVEGLAFDAKERVLLFACKTPRAKALAKDVGIFRWSLDGNALAAPDRLMISRAELTRNLPGKGFHPSALELLPSGEMVLLTSADRAVASLDADGRVTAAASLGGHHRQPEGLVVAGDGTVYVSDEGAKVPGSITVYVCR